MNTFPELHTPRLLLRKIQVDDIPLLVKYGNNRKISDYVLNIPYPYTEPEAVFRISYVHQGFKNGARYVFAIINKENNEFIGEAGLHLDSRDKVAQLGYWIGEPFWNKGFATEAVRAVVALGFNKLELDTIFATCHADNIASQKVLTHNGMLAGPVTGNIIQFRLSMKEYKDDGKA